MLFCTALLSRSQEPSRDYTPTLRGCLVHVPITGWRQSLSLLPWSFTQIYCGAQSGSGTHFYLKLVVQVCSCVQYSLPAALYSVPYDVMPISTLKIQIPFNSHSKKFAAFNFSNSNLPLSKQNAPIDSSSTLQRLLPFRRPLPIRSNFRAGPCIGGAGGPWPPPEI